MKTGERRKKQPFNIDPSLRKGFKLNDAVVMPESGSVVRDGQQHHLPPKAMEILLFLVQNHQRLISSERLLSFGWGDIHANRANLTHAISEIRQALDDHKECPSYIQTLPRRGYRLIAKVSGIDEKVLYPAVWTLKKSPDLPTEQSKNNSHWHLSLAVLKNSKLFSVSIAFLVTNWVIIQIFDIIFPIFNVPEWGLKLAVLILVIGLPLTLLYTWLKEIKTKKLLFARATSGDEKAFFYRQLGVDLGFIGLLTLAVGWLSFYLIESIEKDALNEEVVFSRAQLTLPIQDNLVAIPRFQFEPSANLPDYFEATMQSELIHGLAVQRQFKLVSQRAVNELDLNSSLIEYANNLGARYLIEGRVFGEGEQIKLIIGIVDTTSAHQVWSSEISAERSNLLALNKATLRQIFNALALLSKSDLNDEFLVLNTNDFKAYDLYIQGKNVLANASNISDVMQSQKYFMESLQIDSSFNLALAGLCNAYLSEYSYNDSANAFELANNTCSGLLKADNLKEEGLIALGSLNHLKGQVALAESYFQRALEFSPQSLSAIAGLARVKQELGDYDGATQLMEQLIRIEPGYWRNYQRLGAFLYSLGRYEQAIEPFRQMSMLRPDSAEALNGLGAAYFMSLQTDKAIDTWRASLALDKSAENYSNLGTVLFFAKDYLGAIENHKKALEINANDEVLWINLAEAQKFAGHLDDARLSFRKALQALESRLNINPNNYSALSMRARVYAELNSCNIALNAVNNLNHTQLKDPYYYYDLSLVFLICDDKPQALNSVQLALKNGYPKQLLVNDVQFMNVMDEIRELSQGGIL